MLVLYLFYSDIGGKHLWTLLGHTFVQHCRKQHQSVFSLLKHMHKERVRKENYAMKIVFGIS